MRSAREKSCVPKAKSIRKAIEIYTGNVYAYAAAYQCGRKLHICNLGHMMEVDGYILKRPKRELRIYWRLSKPKCFRRDDL